MTDYTQEQEMEIEALEAILMDEFKEIHSGESGLSTSNRCFQITVSAQDDDTDGSFNNPGINTEDLKNLKEKLIQEVASENLGMAMIYTLVTSAKEWLAEKFQDTEAAEAEAEEAAKDDVVVPHGEPVTLETFLAWRERFEAELALERAKLMPESALTAPKEKKLSGRQWFESGRAKGAAAVNEESEEEDEEDIDFDDDDFEVDEEDMLEHYLAEKSDSSTHSSKRAS
ncbi:hypothetical protein Ahy_B09g095100 [Arachis hypogaea]|uniref:RWD domain-containing protein n=1 Tax=Arachis hypogaea TaxID=3818 RepID=A0A444XDB0_ARAHY|nr:hypothetical protein Ahy_B09g095100 [Arachis hypogaea]